MRSMVRRNRMNDKNDEHNAFYRRHAKLVESLVQQPVYLQLESFIKAEQISDEDIGKRQVVLLEVEIILKREFPDCVIYPYGTTVTGIGNNSSSLRIYVDVFGDTSDTGPKVSPAFRISREDQLVTAYELLEKIHSEEYFCSDVSTLCTSCGPSIKFTHISSGVKCYLTFKNILPVQNSKLLSLMMQLDVRATYVMLFVRYWAQYHKLTGPKGIPDFAFSLLVLVFFVKKEILPAVSVLQMMSNSSIKVNSWNASFSTDCSQIFDWMAINDYNVSSISSSTESFLFSSVVTLIQEFFRMYADVDLQSLVVCSYLGDFICKDFFIAGNENKLPNSIHVYQNWANLRKPTSRLNINSLLCIQEPFDLGSNVCCEVSEDLVRRFQLTCGKTAENVGSFLKSNTPRLMEILQPGTIKQTPLINDNSENHEVKADDKSTVLPDAIIAEGKKLVCHEEMVKKEDFVEANQDHKHGQLPQRCYNQLSKQQNDEYLSQSAQAKFSSLSPTTFSSGDAIVASILKNLTDIPAVFETDGVSSAAKRRMLAPTPNLAASIDPNLQSMQNLFQKPCSSRNAKSVKDRLGPRVNESMIIEGENGEFKINSAYSAYAPEIQPKSNTIVKHSPQSCSYVGKDDPFLDSSLTAGMMHTPEHSSAEIDKRDRCYDPVLQMNPGNCIRSPDPNLVYGDVEIVKRLVPDGDFVDIFLSNFGNLASETLTKNKMYVLWAMFLQDFISEVWLKCFKLEVQELDPIYVNINNDCEYEIFASESGKKKLKFDSQVSVTQNDISGMMDQYSDKILNVTDATASTDQEFDYKLENNRFKRKLFEIPVESKYSKAVICTGNQPIYSGPGQRRRQLRAINILLKKFSNPLDQEEEITKRILSQNHQLGHPDVKFVAKFRVEVENGSLGALFILKDINQASQWEATSCNHDGRMHQHIISVFRSLIPDYQLYRLNKWLRKQI